MKIKKLLACITVTVLVTLTAGCDLLQRNDSGPNVDRELPRELSTTETMVVDGSNDFTFRMLHQLQSKENKNSFFISPLSISMAFGMALNGAEGATFDQMRDFFGYEGMTREEINQSYRDLITLLVELDPSVTLNIANSIWIREGTPVKESFLENNRTFFNAMVQELDFNDPEAVDTINNWIADQTDNLIKKMVDDISRDQFMFLVNAIYFQGDWSVQFDPEKTEQEAFTLPGGEMKTLPMMEVEEQFRVYQDSSWIALDMWYGQAGYSFTALMPTHDRSLGEMAPDLTSESFDKITSDLEERKVTVHMPRFELKYKLDGFKQHLIDMGLDKPFIPNEADFSGITDQFKSYISDVAHKAMVKVNEQGTEAAAATSIGVSAISLNEVRLDRPFYFFIRENDSNTILFMGAYTGL